MAEYLSGNIGKDEFVQVFVTDCLGLADITLGEQVGFSRNELACFSSDLIAIHEITAENKNSFLRSAAFGVAGLTLFGPAGGIAGYLLGSKKEKFAIIAACELTENRHCIIKFTPREYEIAVGLINPELKSKGF